MIKSYAEMRKIDVSKFCEEREAKDDRGRNVKVKYLNWARCKELLHDAGAEKVWFEPCTTENGSSLFMSDQVFTDKNGVTNRCYEVRVKITIDDDVFAGLPCRSAQYLSPCPGTEPGPYRPGADAGPESPAESRPVCPGQRLPRRHLRLADLGAALTISDRLSEFKL